MKWPTAISFDVWSKIEPSVARRLNVVPIAIDHGIITVVYGSSNILEKELNQIVTTLSFALNWDAANIKVLPLGSFEESAETDFKELMNKRYEIEDENEALICDAVASDAMTVLFLSRRPTIFRLVESMLFGENTNESHHTPQILEVRSFEKALDIASTKRGIGKILIMHDAVPDISIEDVTAKFKAACDTKIIVLLEDQDNKLLSLPSGVECEYLGKSKELLVALNS